MPTTLYLVRHGETEYNRLRRVQGRSIDAPLNARGREQAACLAERLAGTPLDAVYVSALRRTHETAAPLLARRSEVPLHRLPDLDEMDWGVWEGRASSDDVREAFRAIQARWARGEFGWRIDRGESILNVQARALAAFGRIREAHPDGAALVVTHGRWLRVLLASVLPGYGLERMAEVRHANTGVNKLTLSGDSVAVAYLNCTRHLDARK